MVWWVYQQARKAARVDQVWVAADHPAVAAACQEYHIPCRMTSPQCPTSTQRVLEAARSIGGDLFVCVNGDEPLLKPALVDAVVPQRKEGFFAANLMAPIHSPVEAVDETNIKVVTDQAGNALYFSRSPIPHPKGSVGYRFYKHLGVLCYSMEALEFFDKTPRGPLEAAEDVNELRFVEHGRPLRMIPVEGGSLSVDTPKDLEFVRRALGKQLGKGEV